MKTSCLNLFLITVVLLATPALTMASTTPEDTSSEERSHWPHLLGKSVGEVTKAIKEERPELHVVEVPQNSMVTMDMRFDRVRIFSDVNGNVVKPPRIG